MKLSTRTRYGLRAILELAQNYNAGPVQIKAIATHQDISAKYLEQLMAILKSAALVRSIRGSKGGYILAKAPDKIKLSNCLNALEGTSVLGMECLENESSCARASDCVTRNVWAKIQQAIKTVTESITLQDMLNMAAEKNLHYQI
jgi:Rrf2 family protein